MSKKLWDVIIVGGGPAGITAALRLARENVDVLVVEAAVYPGAENWSGAVYFAENLADPAVLGEEELAEAPYERRVVKRGFFATNGLTMAGAEYRNPETFRHCYTVLRPVYDRYLAERARALGATTLSETTVDGLIRRGERVIGVHTDRGPLYGNIVFLAEGDASHLVSKEGFERDVVRSKASGQPGFLQGVKEVIELDAATIEGRFGVGPGEAACYEIMLRNGAIDGNPVRLNMAGLIYTNRSSVSIGLVLPLENLTALSGDYNKLMEWYKGLPPIRRLIEGGESTSYGAKIIRGGGLRELPQLVDEGVAIGGAASGIGVDFPYPNFTGPACAMGRIFADAVIQLGKNGDDPTRERLEALYVKPLKATNYYKDVEHLRDWPAFIEHSEALFGRQIDLLTGSLYVMTRPELGFARQWWEAVRLICETLKGRWLKTLGDLRGGVTALRTRRYVAKHAPLALLLSIPNTLLALFPFVYGKGPGELEPSFWVKGEEPGRLPWYKRWSYARYRSALKKAAAIVYANDAVPIAKKLDRAVGVLLRRFSLWEIVLGIFGLAVFCLTRAVQRLSDLIGFAVKKPTLEELKKTFYARWLMGWRALTDLSAAAVGEAKSHDAKLGEISYSGEPSSHIKVFFAPEKPGTLEDPSKAALWSVCPAAVYQIVLDRTMHASVAVNFENCVKCETCWRIEPQHVDWSRFGAHRLIYEVYTGADAALRRIIGERHLSAAREIEPSYWSAMARDGWPSESIAAPDEVKEALAGACRAVALAEAKCSELHEDVWQGPRVLEPGQVGWYRSAIEYFAALADEAAAMALAEPLESWLVEHELSSAHVELLKLKRDIETVSARLREHAGAQRFFAAEADARQIRDHHLAGLRRLLDRLGEVCLVALEQADPVAALRALEAVSPQRAAARAALREHVAGVFDRIAIRLLEHGGVLEEHLLETLRAATRAALGDGTPGGAFDGWAHLEREDILAELAWTDPSLAALVAGHLSGVEALERAGAPAKVVDPLKRVKYFTTVALEAQAEVGEGEWNGVLPFTLTAAAESFVARGAGRLGLIEVGAKGLSIESTPAMGLSGADVAELTLTGVKTVWEGDWSGADEAALFAGRSRDVAAIALGASSLMTERAVDHARSRIQFPDMFQDMDGRDAVGKFGAVRAHIAHIEASRLAIETLLQDAAWRSGELEALVAKVAVTDLFGPDIPSITYRAGQVIGGSAFSEEDVFSKVYRDSSIFPHYIRENAQLNVEIGERIAAGDGAPLATISDEIDEALTAMARRPIFDFEAQRLRAAEEQLGAALGEALERGAGASADQAIHDIAGELATRLYIWARLLVRAHRRLEGSLPAERYVEAAQLWADVMEERLVALAGELEAAVGRVELGRYAFQLGDYPDAPIASERLGFDYERDIIKAERNHRSGDFLLKPLDVDETRCVPELIWADVVTRTHYEEYLELFRGRYAEGDWQPSFERYVEQLHYIPREDLDWAQRLGAFRVLIPKEYGGQGRSKADYYNLCMIAKRIADVSHTLTIQANYSIGTTPMVLGLDDVRQAEQELQGAVDQADAVAGIAAGIRKILAMMERPDFEALKNAYIELDKQVRGAIGKSRILKKVVFGKFMSAWGKAGMAGIKGDLDGFAQGLEKAAAALDGWWDRAGGELAELPRRRLAHEFYLRLIAARMISAFALTEPSAGSDTARQRTEARLDSRRVYTDEDGVKYFYLDESNQEGRRNIADMRRFEFDFEDSKIYYRYSDEAEPAEVHSLEYSYEEDEEKHRYFMIGDRRVDIHDMALVRERDGDEYYEFYVLNGAKMWITNAHIAGVEAIYARTAAGVTGFMVDALTEGFLVGKDEEKTGQRASCTNEITLTNVRIPRECMIGIEGRGQENALETLNVGRTGLCVSSAASIQQAIGDAAAYLAKMPRGSEGWARYRLGLALEEMFAVESLSYDLIGIYDDKTSDMPRVESSVGKLFGTDGLHRNLHYLEPLYGIDGQLQRYRIEKDRRDARVMTIYEGTNEIQQFLLLKDTIDMVGPKLEKLEGLAVGAEGSPYADEARVLGAMMAELHERIGLTRKTYKSAAWQKALVQPIFFRISRMVALVKAVETVVRRAHWVARNLTADGDEVRRAWCDAAARGFVARAHREFERLASGFDRDLETLNSGGRTSELRLAETVFDEADAAGGAQAADAGRKRIERTPIERDLEIVVAMEQAARLAPRPRLDDGRLAEHVFGPTAGDRRALRLALALKGAAPDRVRLTLICAAPIAAEDQLRFGLAAGADRAILLHTRGREYPEHAVADAFVGALGAAGVNFDLLLCGASHEGPSGGRLALRLAGALGAEWLPGVTDLWVAGDAAIYASERFPDTVRSPLPAVGAVAGEEGEVEWEFTTAGFAAALGKPLEVIPFPADADRSDETFAGAAAAVSAEEREEAGSVEPERAAELLVEVGDLGDGAGAPIGAPYAGDVRQVDADALDWPGVVFIAELDGDDLARNARAPLDAAKAIAARASQTLSALVLSGPLKANARRTVAGELMAAAPLERIVFVEHEALASGAPRAYGEALVRLMGSQAPSRPGYLLTSPWLAEALPTLAAELRAADVAAEELAGVSRIEFLDGDGIAFVRPVHERKLRARRQRAAAVDGMRIVWCEPEVAAEPAELERVKADVVRVELELDYDPETDALARALAEARKALGVVTLENAEFVIDVGAGLGSVDNLETVVEPLRQALLELGAPHVEIGATRKVTMDMSWLPDEHQIGQTGVRVNPRVMIALGVSGAPQHIDWVADRAVIFAFNLDPQAPLMTLNQRREQPKVVPVVGDLMKTVPLFIAALKKGR
ncbi:MAG: FAD-binding protein [Gemmatimonadota bacterium]|nr:MAG: FAD-binding protein [Gemmatimonadota bacterium]